MDNYTHSKIGVIGSGSWATAMIKMLTDNIVTKDIFWWIRKEDDIDFIRTYRHNPTYMTAIDIKVPIASISADVRWVVHQSDIVVLNTPAAYLKSALEGLESQDFEGKIIVSAIKGIIPDENLIVGEYLVRRYAVPLQNILVIGGPCHAEEVAQEKLSYLTFGCQDTAKATEIAKLFANRYIKTIVSDDIIGIEYGAVLKNIYALAGGICHGLGYGDNFQAVLVSNAIREMDHFMDNLEPKQRDIKDSAYLGDLLVTAYSQFSRNRTFGAMIGKGYTVQSAQLEMNMVAEGYYAASCIQNKIRQLQLSMPICDMVFDVLYNHKTARTAVTQLAEDFT